VFRQFLYDAGQAVKLLSSYLVPIVFSSVPYEEQPIASNVLTNSLRFMLHDTSSSAILRTLGTQIRRQEKANPSGLFVEQ